MYDPWGRDQPVRDDSGKIAGRKRAITSTGPVQVEDRPSLINAIAMNSGCVSLV